MSAACQAMALQQMWKPALLQRPAFKEEHGSAHFFCLMKSMTSSWNLGFWTHLQLLPKSRAAQAQKFQDRLQTQAGPTACCKRDWACMRPRHAVDELKEHPHGWRCDTLLRMAWCMRQARKESLLGDTLAFCQKPLYRLFEVWLCQRGIDSTLRLTQACRRKIVSSALRNGCNNLRCVSKSKHHRCSWINTLQDISTTPRKRHQLIPPDCPGQPHPLQQHRSNRAVGSRQCVCLWFQG